ncbi:MAG: hypothetical protein WC728_14895 [Elusimicrobiota bacterium]
MRDFTGACPWCGLDIDVWSENPRLPWSRRCSCGAIALGAPEGEQNWVIDAMALYYAISPGREGAALYGDLAWLAEFYIKTEEGGRSFDASAKKDVFWRWFKRELPWERPTGPMTNEERLAWLESQGEAFRGRRAFREAREAFEEAIVLARGLGWEDKAGKLEKRLKQL